MKILKRVLVGLGVLFCLLVLVAGSLLYLGMGFKGEHEAFVREFMADYSRRWEVADVHARLSTEYLEQIRSPNGEQATVFFRRLGRVQEITDLSVENFATGTEGDTAVFVFKARFEAAPAVVRLTVREADDEVRVLGLHVTPVGDLLPVAPAATDV